MKKINLTPRNYSVSGTSAKSRLGKIAGKVSLFLSSLILLACLKVGASHFTGGEITWIYTGIGNDYTITLKLYRDCAGIQHPTSSIGVVFSPSIAPQSSSLPFISRTDITPLCPGQVSNCNVSFGGSGIEEYIYQGVRTLNPILGGGVYTMSNSSCCRNSLLNSTVLSGGSTGWYISSVLDPNVSPRNSSPQFLNPPTARVCCNQPATFNPLAFDPNGDSLVFSLTACLQSAGTPVTYIVPFGPTNPVTTAAGLTLNPNNGQVSFTPTVCGQAGIICIKVEEYRTILGVPTKIGEVTRDVQIQVINCGANNVPVIAAMPDLCIFAGQTVCNPIIVSDPDSGQVVTVTANSGLTFALSPGQICFSPTCADTGTYIVTVTATDDFCPTPGQSTATFTVQVKCQITVDLDIKPTSCPNPLNPRTQGNGVLPVAILGSSSLNVSDINVSTVRLSGVAPIRSSIEDVAGPVVNRQDSCQCTTAGPDGFLDLTLKFNHNAIVATLGPVVFNQVIPMTITGNLNDGTPFSGLDCIVIRGTSGGNSPNPHGPNKMGQVDEPYWDVYPNPVSGMTTFRFMYPSDDNVSLELMDVKGNVIASPFRGEVRGGTELEVHFSTKGVAPGVYFYRWNTSTESFQGKLLILE